MNPEIRYSIKRLDEKRVAVFKWVDDNLAQTYTIENEQCDCPGCLYHKTQCKHLKIRKHWIATDEPNFFNYEVTKKGLILAYRLQDPNA